MNAWRVQQHKVSLAEPIVEVSDAAPHQVIAGNVERHEVG